jgi:predicted dehydrogenase
MADMDYPKVNVGIIGCGVISGAYLEVLKLFDILNVVACADQAQEKAIAKAAQYAIPRVCRVEELIADPNIDIVVNLTTPDVHAEIGMAVLQTGKSLYSEKPLAISLPEVQRLLEMAQVHGGLLGGAPDTFMGGGIQTCRQLIDNGSIGQPVAATAFLFNHGPERWHPNPEFYYQPGGGPLFDMGPYYLTALITLLGPIQRVAGMAKQTFAERTIDSQPYVGQKIAVAVPTHVTGSMEFVNGAIGTLITSFDIWASKLPTIEIYGTEGTLSLPDPSFYDGPIQLWQRATDTWRTVELTHGYSRPSRGIGIADMAYALRTGRRHRANGELIYHVLDTLHAFYDTAHAGRYTELKSTCERPSPLLPNLLYGSLED